MSDINDKKKNIKVNDADYFESNSKREKNDIKSSKSTNGIVYIILTFCVCLCLFGGFYEFYLKHLVIETTKTIKDVTITDTGIADAVEKVYDSVVTVKNYVRNQLYSTGSGFVFKIDNKYGYILTNYHVISGGNEVSVVFTNNKDEKVTIVGYDEYSDIAVLAVDKSLVLATAQLGSSNNMRIGDTTFAVGTPVDSSVYSWSVTRGILSGKDRMVQVDNYVMSVLQTDTAINSGNSGGALVNADGKVIGINTLKLSGTGVEGIGFAIPINSTLSVYNELKSNGKISRPYIGITGIDIDEAKAKQYNLVEGIYVKSIDNFSAAEKAGLKIGDIILEANGTKVKTVDELNNIKNNLKIGDKITLKINRDGKEKEVSLTLQEQ